MGTTPSNRFTAISTWFSIIDQRLDIVICSRATLIIVTFVVLATSSFIEVKNVLAQGGGDYRKDFTEFLANPPRTADPVTLATVRAVNTGLVFERIPMAKDHFIVATQSITRGDNLKQFLIAENAEVLKSNGFGIVYGLGIGLHRLIDFCLNFEERLIFYITSPYLIYLTYFGGGMEDGGDSENGVPVIKERFKRNMNFVR